MSKLKVAFFCQSCGHQSPKWIGKCPNCNSWNTYVEEVQQKNEKNQIWKSDTSHKTSIPIKIEDITYQKDERVELLDSEFNRVLGGGIVPGSLILIGGEPGIGKSTLMLQTALNTPNSKWLYVSGEESEQQIKMRAERITFGQQKVQNSECYILNETNNQNIFLQIQTLQPDFVIVDSIQTLHSSLIESPAGSVSQVRECAGEWLKYAKESGTPTFLIGHITKDGNLAGPKVLEHMVDTVLQFEGDKHLSYRILRTLKNRFGSTFEIGIYEMKSQGMIPVANPSEIFITQHQNGLSGITVGATLEGNRPLLVEVQSLVSPATFGTPQRSCTGYDTKRLNMILAVLEKRGGFKLSQQDVFVNIAGGIKVEDPAIDLAVCISIISSYEDIPVSKKNCFSAEVGLGGEIRAVTRADQRVSEAAKLGFEQVFISEYGTKQLEKNNIIKIQRVETLKEVLENLFG